MATVSGGTTSERFGFIERFGKELGVRYLCDWLGVSKSGYYDWLKREPSRSQKQDIEVLADIRRAHAAVQNLFNLGRHLVRAEHYRNLKVSAFNEWSRAET